MYFFLSEKKMETTEVGHIDTLTQESFLIFSKNKGKHSKNQRCKNPNFRRRSSNTENDDDDSFNNRENFCNSDIPNLQLLGVEPMDIDEMREQVKELKKEFKVCRKICKKIIKENEKTIKKNEDCLKSKDEHIKYLMEIIKNNEEDLKEKDRRIKLLMETIRLKYQRIQNLEKKIKTYKKQSKLNNDTLAVHTVSRGITHEDNKIEVSKNTPQIELDWMNFKKLIN